MNNDQENIAQTKKPRKTRVRSPYLFPMYDFGEARRISERVEQDGGGSLTEETLAIALGVSSKSSGFRLRTLTARQFRLLAKQGQQLVTTPLAKAIFKPTSEQERANASRESFMAIPLFRAVADRFKGQPLPQGEAFRNILEREFRIQSDRVSAAERVLMDSAREAGVLQTAGDKVYVTTQPVLTTQPPIEIGTQVGYSPPSQDIPTVPPSGVSQYGGPSAGGLLTISEEDLAEFDDNEFTQIWQALGKIIRVRGKRQRTEEKPVDDEEEKK